MTLRIVKDYKFFRNTLILVDNLFKLSFLALYLLITYLICLMFSLNMIFVALAFTIIVVIKGVSILLRVRLNASRGQRIKYSIQGLDGKRTIYESNNPELNNIRLGKYSLEEFHNMIMTSLKHIKLGKPYIVFINMGPEPATSQSAKYRGLFFIDFYNELFSVLTKKELYSLIMHKLAHRKYTYSLTNFLWHFFLSKKQSYSITDELFCDYVSCKSTSAVSVVNSLIKSASRYYVYNNVLDKLVQLKKRQNINVIAHIHKIVREIPFSIPYSLDKAVKLDQLINSVIEDYGIKYGNSLKGLVPVNRSIHSIESSVGGTAQYDWMNDNYKSLRKDDIVELYNAISTQKRNSIFNVKFFNTVIVGTQKKESFFPVIEKRLKNIINNFLE